MKYTLTLLTALLLALFYTVTVPIQALSGDELAQGFYSPPDRVKPWVMWFWMGGNINKEGITADLEAMKKVGLGGAIIMEIGCPTPGKVSYMSDEWRGCMKHAADEANRLGLELAVHNSPGWTGSGGPWITPEYSMQMVVSSETNVTGSGMVRAVLPKPFSRLGWYHDIAVFAIPSAGKTMRECRPEITSDCPPFNSAKLTDGDWSTVHEMPCPEKGKPHYIQFAFSEPFTARSVMIVSGPKRGGFSGTIQVSQDGNKFKTVQNISLGSAGQNQVMFTAGFDAVTARYFRVVITKTAGDGPRIPLAEIEFSAEKHLNNWAGKVGYMPNSKGTPSKFPAAEAIALTNIVDCTARMNSDGSFAWEAPAGNWRILRIGYTSTGVKNHPEVKGGDGLQCDKLSKAAFDTHWNGMLKKILADGTQLRGVEIDSYEVGPQNWTAQFRDEFKKRRGYDLLPYLPALTGRIIESADVTERFCWDFRKTIAELFAENYWGRFGELCRQNKITSYVEHYGAPSYFDEIASGLPCDVPMDTFWNDEKITGHRQSATSVAHTAGKPILGAEAFTCAREKAGWRESPFSMKALGDDRFCSGINKFIIHRYALQPWPNVLPGMAMGACGIHFERTTTWWAEAPAWTIYLSRCQSLLQRGRWVGDIACFTGEQIPDYKQEADVPKGYQYDLVHPMVLANMRVMDGRLTLPHGMSYRLLVLPNEAETMTLETIRKIRDLVSQGAVVLGTRPVRTPGLAGYPDSEAELKRIADEIWGACDGKTVLENKFGKGRVFCGKNLEAVLAAIGCKPDFEYRGDGEINYTHRVESGTDIYFVATKSKQPSLVQCIFRVRGRVPEFFHPDTGMIEPCTVWHETDGRITVPISFDPVDSVFVVFRKPTTETAHVAPLSEPPQTVQELTGSWEVSFAPGWGAPARITFEKLVSWPEHSDQGIKYFSGAAFYRKTLSVPGNLMAKGRKLFLDLGDVRVIARVKLNGHELGILWKPPFRADITGVVKAGDNDLEVKVVNLWPNRLIGDEQLPADCRFTPAGALSRLPDWFVNNTPRTSGRKTFTTWKHWNKDDTLLPSGLLGPVRLMTQDTSKKGQVKQP